MLLYSIGLELTILLAFWLCLGVWQKDRSTTGRATFVALGFSVVLWCSGELMALREVLDEAVADRIKYLGILSLPSLWLGLAGHAARLELARRVPWFPVVLLAPMACLYALMFSGHWSGLFVTTIPNAPDQHGPLWWVAGAYGYLLIATGSALLIASAFRRRRWDAWLRSLVVGVVALIPLAANTVYVARGMPWTTDPTPLLLGVALLALRSAIFSGGLLQALSISQHDLIRQLPLGVILTDRRGVVIDVNRAAERRLCVSQACAVGRTLDAILSEAESHVRADVVPIFSQNREAGQLVLIDPPAKRREEDAG
jgi:PAS domain-containing protein